MRNYFVFVSLLVSFFLQSCKEETIELLLDDKNISANCIDSDLVYEINREIPFIVRKTDKNFYHYEGHDYYLELDAKKYASIMYEDAKKDQVQVYVVGNLEEFENQTVTLKGGEIHWCLTAAHGLSTANLYSFYILKNSVVKTK